ncbi:LSU ribosomal protein L25p [Leifsonia rubra CMS 76R]|nr:LSU ribosomal protein L25p [Leifsonia rubra CMS 76R]
MGESAPGTTVDVDAHSLLVEAAAVSIPENIKVSIEGLEAGSHILAKEIELPEGVNLIADPETLIVAVSAETEQDLGEDAPAEAEDEAAEGETPAEESAE